MNWLTNKLLCFLSSFLDPLSLPWILPLFVDLVTMTHYSISTHHLILMTHILTNTLFYLESSIFNLQTWRFTNDLQWEPLLWDNVKTLMFDKLVGLLMRVDAPTLEYHSKKFHELLVMCLQYSPLLDPKFCSTIVHSFLYVSIFILLQLSLVLHASKFYSIVVHLLWWYKVF